MAMSDAKTKIQEQVDSLSQRHRRDNWVFLAGCVSLRSSKSAKSGNWSLQRTKRIPAPDWISRAFCHFVENAKIEELEERCARRI